MLIRLRDAALLALPSITNAVSLSDMTPRAQNLPPACNAVYTSQIWGCTPSDFSTFQCSQSCISAMYGLVQAINHACRDQGVQGQNLVVAFLAGVGPQQLCHNLDSNGPPTNGPPIATTHHPVPVTPSIISSTTTARKPTNTETSLIVDTSSTMSSSSSIPHTTQKTEKAHTQSPTTRPSPNTTSRVGTPILQTSQTQSTRATTSAATAAGSSQTNLNDHSGGGSPFDSPGNMMNSASSTSLSAASLLLSAAAAIFALR